MSETTNGEHEGFASGMIGEAFALGAFVVCWVVVVAATNWLSILHSAVPVTIQALALAGMTAFLMLSFQRWTGGHLNPLMTLAMSFAGKQNWRAAIGYSVAHILSALGAIALTYAFLIDRPVFPVTEARIIAEFLGAAVLMNAVVALRNEAAIDAALGIGAAVALIYWVSGGQTLVNPAITLAQGAYGHGLNMMLAGPVIAAQFSGALSGYHAARLLWP